MIKIRSIKKSDAKQIEKLADDFAAYLTSIGSKCINKFKAKDFVKNGFGPDRYFEGFCACHGNQVIGYALFYKAYRVEDAVRTLHIEDIYVHEKWRKQGVGLQLMNGIKKLAKKDQVKELHWTVAKENSGAVKFYKKMGAQENTSERLMYLDL